MKFKLFTLALVSFVMLSAVSSSYAQSKKMKKRIAVFVFKDKTDKRYHWWNHKGVGEGMTDMLTTSLVKDGNYTVIERSEIDRIMKEQALGASGAVSEASAAKIGQLLGVEFAVIGAVTEFGYTKSKKGGRIGGIGLGVSKQKSVVAIDCRFVNTSTGEIIAAEHVRKQKSKKGVTVDTRLVDYKSQSDFDESLVGKATNEAITDLVSAIGKYTTSMKWQAKVIMEKGGKVYINSGKIDGVKAGETFEVYRAGEELIDPDTGISLGSTETKVGTIKVANPTIGNGKASICTIVSGESFKKGDVVKEIKE